MSAARADIAKATLNWNFADRAKATLDWNFAPDGADVSNGVHLPEEWRK